LSVAPEPAGRDHPDKQTHVQTWGVYKTRDGGYHATGLGSTFSLGAQPLRIACSAGRGGKRTYRAHVEITHGLDGKRLGQPLCVVSPTVTTSLGVQVVRDPIETFLHKWVFDMYVRLVALCRARLDVVCTPGTASAFDRGLAQNPMQTVVDLGGVLPEGVHAVCYPPVHKMVHDLVEQLFVLSGVTFISAEDIKNFYKHEGCDDEGSSSSSSESSDDEDE
jgi:hypothetical protein